MTLQNCRLLKCIISSFLKWPGLPATFHSQSLGSLNRYLLERQEVVVLSVHTSTHRGLVTYGLSTLLRVLVPLVCFWYIDHLLYNKTWLHGTVIPTGIIFLKVKLFECNGIRGYIHLKVSGAGELLVRGYTVHDYLIMDNPGSVAHVIAPLPA